MSEEVALAVADHNHTITFDPPLPCATIAPGEAGAGGGRWCGKPAIVGQIYPMGGGYFLQPICKDCTAKLAAIYLGGAP